MNNQNVVHIARPAGSYRPAVEAALAALDLDLNRFFAVNGPRPVYVRITWKGRYYVARATYAATGGETMTIATRCT